MSRKKIKRLVLLGLGCLALLAAAIVYSIFCNESRWVVQMDMASYVFRGKDLPMLAAGLLTMAYVVYLVASAFRAALRVKREEREERAYTRRISPWLGLFGFCGLFGLTGFWTYREQGVIFPFLFFAFFGFFGFFYEGKLSHLLKDERYQENERRAERTAYRIGFGLLFLVMWLVGMGMLSQNLEWCAIFLFCAISLIYGLVLFLSRFLLYRYEKGD